MATVVGFAFWGLSVMPVGKRVFLLVITTIPNAMRCMATTATTAKKRPSAVKKSAVGGKKRAACGGLLNPKTVIRAFWAKRKNDLSALLWLSDRFVMSSIGGHAFFRRHPACGAAPAAFTRL